MSIHSTQGEGIAEDWVHTLKGDLSRLMLLSSSFPHWFLGFPMTSRLDQRPLFRRVLQECQPLMADL